MKWNPAGKQFQWWQKAVFYQIYPRSFADANGDGLGDFRGMTARLDYLADLGVDAIWLSPHYPSPYVDCGYDISDYRGVAPEYGSLKDFQSFLEGLHRRGMRLILDMVFNHTSDRHPWFIESRSSRTNPKRDWFVWQPGRNDGPPNNWCSTFGGSAWEWDAITGEYYYHFFFKEQPDLNWSNPQVKEAMFNDVRFWLDMGVDGFRLDAIGTLFENPDLPDHPGHHTLDDLYRLSREPRALGAEDPGAAAWEEIFQYQHDQPGVHEMMKELRALVDHYPGAVLVGETDDLAFYGNGKDELHLNFNFPLMRTNRITARHVLENQKERLTKIPEGAWPCNTFGNHDSSRMLNQFGDGRHDDAIARINLLLLLTLPGTPFLYNGEEIGMRDYLIQDPRRFRDPLSNLNYENEMRLMGTSPEEAVRYGAERGRDKCRTPMQWNGHANAGFCPAGVEPWLPVNPDYREGVNVHDQEKDPASLLNWYRQILAFRKHYAALQAGDFYALSKPNQPVLVFTRGYDGEHLLVLLNLSADLQQVSLPEEVVLQKQLISIQGGSLEMDRNRLLAPFQGEIWQIE